MKIYKVVTDKKPTNCIECPLIKLRVCGAVKKQYASSGAVYYESIPDNRCLIRAK
jgi:hypothetical protein